MYLKSLEIQGFKSFANKIKLEFPQGISAIVGPNGSGKSNIADALRWVLGEQKVKQLRSNYMQEVIFAGTHLRKAQGLASVSVCFSNQDKTLAIDYEEVTIARRIYRSGESEYLLNGHLCRLKDISELLEDTGLGKEGYSLIGQGQIEQILSGSPSACRELLDEATGISKYRNRKEATQRKLDQQKQDFLRLQDILSEIDRQREPLRKQAQEAKNYEKLRQEQKQLELSLFCEFYQEQEEQEKVLRQQLDQLQKDWQQLNESIRQTEEKVLILEQEIQQREELYQEQSKACQNNELLIRQEEGKRQLVSEQILHQKELIKNNQQRISVLTEQKSEYEKQVQQKQSEQEKNQQKKEELRQKKEKLEQEKREIHLLEEKDKEQEREYQSEEEKLKKFFLQYQIKQEQKNIFQKRDEEERTKNQENLQKFLDYSQNNQEKLLSLEKEKENQQEQEQILEDQEKKLKNLGQKLEETIRLQENAYQEKKYKKEQIFHQQETLKKWEEHYEGYPLAIKKIMKKQKEELLPKEEQILGTVAELLSAKAQYELAIETALGASLQHLVVEKEQAAKKWILYLKQNSLGKATFYPLENLQYHDFSYPNALKEKGVEGLGKDLVEIAPEIAVLARFLLGRIIVTDTLDHALLLAKQYTYRFRIVTMDGELLHSGGSLTGGKSAHPVHLLGRKREKKEQNALLESLTKQLTELDEKKQEMLLQYEVFQKDKKRWEEEKKQNQFWAENLFWQIKQQQEEKKQWGIRYQELKEKMDEAEEENKREQRQSEKEEKEKIVYEERIQIIQREKQKNEKSQKKFFVQQQKIEEQLKDIYTKEIEIQSKEQYLQETLQQGKQQEKSCVHEIIDLEEKKQKAQEEITEKERQLENLAENQQNRKKAQQEFSLRLENDQKQLKEKNEERKSGQKEKERMKEQLGQLEKILLKLEQNQEKLKTKKKEQEEYIWSAYELTYRGALEEILEKAKQIEEMQTKVVHSERLESIKKEIRNLNTVNVRAIEEYQILEERYQFLQTQVQDLEESKQQLLDMIEELNQGMKKQFRKGFQAVSEAFFRVFQELFGGGQASLQLIGEDVLEAGVKISAQPPGKKLQNMMQLSGGEKTLTAISLLFAIQQLNPSPFCILDEIEASLDEANAKRFIQYLEKLKEKTQFILITHKRISMSAADCLYGITMQEKGVSSLVSVELTKKNDFL
ncbi:chromosome partition protein Smc [Clostridia bacterium]|nr:chromosome partition protein Smc [Clostridia bacterium]